MTIPSSNTAASSSYRRFRHAVLNRASAAATAARAVNESLPECSAVAAGRTGVAMEPFSEREVVAV
jgi:hypothetical protein